MEAIAGILIAAFVSRNLRTSNIGMIGIGITFIITICALGVSILTVNLYASFCLRHRVLKSLWGVPLVFMAFFLCIFFALIVPGVIIGILYDNLHLPLAYRTISGCSWAILTFAYAAYRFLYKARQR